jgi:DNA-cytosine methyltransferase
MNVLSLFDGMSCLQIALKELNIDYGTYYASEIDKYAIAQTQLNFPNTIQLGSVTEWQSWDIDWSKIGLIGAGSPCQGFSFAGKQLAFNDERSKLFFVFVDILNHAKYFNPDVKFLFENVNMKKSHMKIINDFLGLRGVNINSNLVSAQNRNRWYWSNIRTKREGLFGDLITDIPQPQDKGILLRDILEDEVDEKYYLSEKILSFLKNHAIKRNQTFVTKNKENKCNPVNTRLYKLGIDDNYIQNIKITNNNKSNIRRLTPLECAKLQTIPDWYKWNCSETQQYKMLGNGWTVEIIKHILKFIEV